MWPFKRKPKEPLVELPLSAQLGIAEAEYERAVSIARKWQAELAESKQLINEGLTSGQRMAGYMKETSCAHQAEDVGVYLQRTEEKLKNIRKRVKEQEVPRLPSKGALTDIEHGRLYELAKHDRELYDLVRRAVLHGVELDAPYSMDVGDDNERS